MPALLDLPDQLFSTHILKYLTSADLWRLGCVCHKFHRNDTEENVIQSEFKERNDALVRSGQYPQKRPLMSLLSFRQRVLAFERCSAFAWKMTRHAQEHEDPDFSCQETFCNEVEEEIPFVDRLGLRNGMVYLFFAQFSCNDTLLWEGFLPTYKPESDHVFPLDDLLGNPDGERRPFDHIREGIFHFDASNVTTLVKDDVNYDLHVTLVSLIHPPEQLDCAPKLRLHYSSRGLQRLLRGVPRPDHDSVSIDVMTDNVLAWQLQTPAFIWKSKSCLHTFSLVYQYDFHLTRVFSSY